MSHRISEQSFPGNSSYICEIHYNALVHKIPGTKYIVCTWHQVQDVRYMNTRCTPPRDLIPRQLLCTFAAPTDITSLSRLQLSRLLQKQCAADKTQTCGKKDADEKTEFSTDIIIEDGADIEQPY